MHFWAKRQSGKAVARLDTLILNQNSFGCEGVANLCEELSKCSAQVVQNVQNVATSSPKDSVVFCSAANHEKLLEVYTPSCVGVGGLRN